MKLIIASNNKGKINEIKKMLSKIAIEVLSQSEAGINLDVEETGSTFMENAELKATAVYNAAKEMGLDCFVLADDSGISVDALNGEPGVMSHRWAGENLTDEERINKLLEKMNGVTNRDAKATCAMCLVTPNTGSNMYFAGVLPLKILEAPRGTNGFGYDPILLFNDKSLAEMTADEKNAISHRHQALEHVVNFLYKYTSSLEANSNDFELVDYDKVAGFWENTQYDIAKAPDKVVIEQAYSILDGTKAGVLGTTDGTSVDLSPVDYVLHNHCIYITSEGGAKFKNLKVNKNVGFTVYNADGGFGNLHSVQIEGVVSNILVNVTNEYLEVISKHKYKPTKEFLLKRQKDGIPMHLIKIVPKTIKVTSTDLPKLNYSVRQTVINVDEIVKSMT